MSVDLTKWQVYTSNANRTTKKLSVESRSINAISAGSASCVTNPEACCPIVSCCAGRSSYPSKIWAKFTNDEIFNPGAVFQLDYQGFNTNNCHLYYVTECPSRTITTYHSSPTYAGANYIVVNFVIVGTVNEISCGLVNATSRANAMSNFIGNTALNPKYITDNSHGPSHPLCSSSIDVTLDMYEWNGFSTFWRNTFALRISENLLT